MRWLFPLVLLALGACALHESGTWDDDPRNWDRAFPGVKPEGVTVVHSRYHRSPHFTLEYEYFFELEPTPELRRQLIDAKNLRVVERDAASRARGHRDGLPEWFAPEAITDYEVWVPEDPASGYAVLVDRRTGRLFVTDSQL